VAGPAQPRPGRLFRGGPPAQGLAGRRIHGGHHLFGRHPPVRGWTGGGAWSGGQLGMVEFRCAPRGDGRGVRAAVAPQRRAHRRRLH
jgi:hypothetical protein